jgi:hypothetical protein
MGGLPAGMTADVWTGGEDLPDPAGEPLRNVAGPEGY